MQAAKAANAHEFIQNMENGYDTIVGERGVKLSGGQRQRIAIARAFLKNAPILLFDEATSSLDSRSEQLIQSALKEMGRNKTVILIAHRLSTIEHADLIFVMDDGKVIEKGKHEELLINGGLYKSLYEAQFNLETNCHFT
jgi:ABC-type multidrug transport system fused ATPase/permease subunit